ncbi:hypothetical protein Q9189_001032 [Teloschistes chrysophthalmus]
MAPRKRLLSPESDDSMAGPKTPPRQIRSADQVETPKAPKKNKKARKGDSELTAGTPVPSGGVLQNIELHSLVSDKAYHQHLLAPAIATPDGQLAIPPTAGPFMASSSPADGLPQVPFTYRPDLSATTNPNNAEAPGMNLPSLGPNPVPSPNQSSDPTLQNRLLADPARAAYYDARIRAAGRTSQRSGDPIFPTSAFEGGPRQSMGREQPRMQTFGQAPPGVVNYMQGNPELANFHSNVSTHGSIRSDQVALSTESNYHSASAALASAGPFQPPHGVTMTNMERPDQQEIANPSDQGFLSGSIRDRPRTRFHPSFGHAGIDRSYRSQTQNGGPIVAQTPTFPGPLTSTQQSSFGRIVSSGPLTCSEQPEFWEKGVLWSNSHDTRENEVATHSGPMMRCSNARAHTGTHLVCTKCRVEGSEHLEKHFGDLLPYPKFFKLCNRCAGFRIPKPADPGDVNQDGKLVRFRCRCNHESACFDCKLNDLRVAKINYDAENVSRRGMSIMFGTGRTVQMEDVCICGANFNGTERCYQCVTCRDVRQVPM